jgi:hypothetical protein
MGSVSDVICTGVCEIYVRYMSFRNMYARNDNNTVTYSFRNREFIYSVTYFFCFGVYR